MVTNRNAVKHALIPAAGLGTRFLPFTKTVPKELLPLGNCPCVDYIVAEATTAGINDVAFITRPGKEAVIEYFEPDAELDSALEGTPQKKVMEEHGKRFEGVKISGVDQMEPAGLGHAIAQGASHVGDNPFAVLLPDDLIPPDQNLLRQMIAVREELGGSVVAAIRVTPQQATAYGSIGYEPANAASVPQGSLMRVTELVEKPPVDQVLSEYAVSGRYVLDPAVFDILNTLSPGRGGEVQLTDALAELAQMDPADGGGLHALIYEGIRYDTGTPTGYLDAYLRSAMEDPDNKNMVEGLLRSLLENVN